MARDSDNFINELKFDELKESGKKFLLKYYTYIVVVIVALVGFFTARFSLRNMEKSRIERYNERIFLGTSSGKPIAELEKIYRDESIPSVSKTFSGLSLIGEYIKSQRYERVVEIYEDIFTREKDVYLKYYAGLNLLIVRLNEEKPDVDKISILFSKLENGDNPLLNLVIEQKALFFIKQKKYDQAAEIIRNLLKRGDIDSNFRERLGRYLDFSQRRL
ncbi:MAG: hypothetical protein LBB24_01690 [Rickettsiales bacterium]|nr:hypothetical protein [Rickettsiales bacterium]